MGIPNQPTAFLFQIDFDVETSSISHLNLIAAPTLLCDDSCKCSSRIGQPLHATFTVAMGSSFRPVIAGPCSVPALVLFRVTLILIRPL